MTTARPPSSIGRRRLVAGAMAAAALTVSGCSPISDGITGITRDAQGRLVGLWHGCHEEPVGATLIQDSNTPGSVHLGEWRAAEPSLAASFSLESSPAPSGWTTWDPGLEAVEPGHVYTLVAWKKLNSTNARAVDFTLPDLDRLSGSAVLIGTDGPERVTVVSRDDFDQLACRAG